MFRDLGFGLGFGIWGFKVECLAKRFGFRILGLGAGFWVLGLGSGFWA